MFLVADIPHEYVDDEGKGQDCYECGNSWYDVPHQVWLEQQIEVEAVEVRAALRGQGGD